MPIVDIAGSQHVDQYIGFIGSALVGSVTDHPRRPGHPREGDRGGRLLDGHLQIVQAGRADDVLADPLVQFAFDRTYIKATLDPKSDLGGDALWRAADRAKKSDAWRYVEIESTHMVASNKPGELAAILLKGLGEGPSGGV